MERDVDLLLEQLRRRQISSEKGRDLHHAEALELLGTGMTPDAEHIVEILANQSRDKLLPCIVANAPGCSPKKQRLSFLEG